MDLIYWASFFAVLVSYLLFFSNKKVKTIPALIPGALPIVGHSLKILSSRNWILDMKKKYGDFYTIKISGRNTVVINDLETIKRSMRAPNDTLGFLALVEVVTGYDDDTKGFPGWKTDVGIEFLKSKVLIRSSAAEQLIVDTTNSVVNEIMAKAKKTELEIDISSLTKIIVASTTGKFLFQLDLPIEFYEECSLLEKEQAKAYGFMTLVPFRQKFFKMWVYSSYFKQREKCFAYLFPLIDLHRKGFGDSAFIKYLMEYERGPFSNLEISDLICGLVLASLTNTTNLTTSTFVHLMKYPHYYESVIKEVRSAPIENGEVVFKGNIPVLDAIVHETARFGATVFGSMRLCLKDYDICQQDEILYTVPAGSLILMSHLFKNFNPNIFADPEEYNPDRFLEPRKEKKSEVSNWGGGIHLCPGKNLALEEAKIITATIIRNFEVKGKDVEKYGKLLNTSTGAAMSPTSGNNYIIIRKRTTN